jgi:hypothetical protein
MRPDARHHHGYRRSLVAAGIAIALVLAGLAAAGAAAETTPAARAPMRLNVMEFNIEDGGLIVRFQSIVQALERAHPDVVGIEEAQANIPRLARAAGFPYYSVRLQILSRYPLIDPPKSQGLYTFVQLRPGQVVAIGNVHLPSNPYSPNVIKRGGVTPAKIKQMERRDRLPFVQPTVRALAKLVAVGIPSYLTGDFNAPSFRDWTPATVGFLNRPFPLRWPVSVYVEGAGFRDSYREVYPNPRKDPGITWPSGRPNEHGVWNPPPSAPKDRIDFIYEAGATHVVASQIIGESADPVAKITVDPWGSDHRSVMSTVVVTPGVPPTLVAVGDRLVTRGTPEAVTFHAPAGANTRIVVTRAGASVASRSVAGSVDGTVSFSTTGWASGDYMVELRTGSAVLSHIPFWVQAPGSHPSITTSKATYAVGEPVPVRWRNAPGERWDWVGVYQRNADPLVASYLTWAYTKASIAGTATLGGTAYGTWPLKPGHYSVYLLADDGYDILARAVFSVG